MTTTRSNRDLRTRVLDELDWEPSLDSADIGVAVKDGVVTLIGDVPSYAQKRTDRDDIEDAVWAAPGITEVENNLKSPAPATSEGARVAPPPTHDAPRRLAGPGLPARPLSFDVFR